MPEPARPPRPALRARLRAALAAVVRTLTPGAPAWRGATRGVVVGTAVVWGASVLCLLGRVRANWANALALLLLPVVVVVAGLLLVALVRFVAARPVRYLRALAVGLPLLALTLMGAADSRGGWLLAAGAVVAFSLLGAGALSLARGRRTRGQTVVAGLGVLAGAAAVVVALVAVWRDGTTATARPEGWPVTSPAKAVALPPDPATPGPYVVRTLTYGGGTDRRRPEFGVGAALRTEPVDVSRLVENWKGRSGWARTLFWGFDAKHVPLQGRVWYPEGEGPFPLVLAVHGNHWMEESSDPGYAYLGELLASRGTIFVSVDENFLNGSLSDILGAPKVGLKEESDARAMVLLEHLRAWRRFRDDAKSPFRGKVDLDRVVLVGHSRGGEAVAVASVFNRLPSPPADGRVRFDYGFGIRGVVAIAPVDGQFKPGGEGTAPRDVSYLVLHGSHDGDVQSFHGSRVWSRVRFTDGQEHFKAAVYVWRANHGQFNTVWGNTDVTGLDARLLDLAQLLPPEDQRKVAKVCISAFVDAALKGATDEARLFHDRGVARAWLPEGAYAIRYLSSGDRLVADYDEDLDLETATLPGARISAANLTDWREKLVPIKWGDMATRAVYLGWDARDGTPPARYELALPPSVLAPGDALIFDLADAKEDPSPRDPDRPRPAADAGGDRWPIDFTVEVKDAAGATARLPLSHVAPLARQMQARVRKAAFLNATPPSELVFQSYAIPLGDFAGVDPSRITTVRFVFDRTAAGVIVLDDLGFRH